MSSEIYRDKILESYRHPKNYGSIDDAQIKVKESNPLCGDDMEMHLKLDSNNKVSDIKFTGRGCAISIASASMLTELVKGRSLEELRSMDKQELLQKLGIDSLQLNPVRIKCALLSLKTLKVGVVSHLGQQLFAEEINVLENEE